MLQDPLTRSANPTVLLAEDDPDQSEMLSDILQHEGYAVDAAYSGDVAYRKLLHNSYDLIIFDIRMPGMDGGMVLRQYRKQETQSRVPIVVVSAFATDADIQRYKAYGADASFSKPYEIDELLATLTVLAPAAKVNVRTL